MDYGAIIRRSIEVVKKYKWLWIYGAILAGGGGGGGNSISRNFGEDQKTDTNFDQSEIPTQISSVLGTYTASWQEWLNGISPGSLFLLIIGVLMLVVLGVIIGALIRSWAAGALISGVQMGLNNEVVNLSNTTQKGKTKTKNLFYLSLIFFSGVLTLGAIISIIAYSVFLIYTSTSSLGAILLGILIGLVVLVLFGTYLALTQMYAERLIVLEALRPLDAWKTGFRLAKENFWKSILMGVINAISAGVFGFFATIAVLIILGIPSLIMLTPSIASKATPSPFVFGLLGIFILIFVALASLISGITTVYRYANWNQFFEQVVQKESEAQSA